MRNSLPLLLLPVALQWACGDPELPEAKRLTESKPEATAVTKEAPPTPAKKPANKMPADLGNCHITVSGALTLDQTTPGGREAVNVSYWRPESERKTMMGTDGFAVNCIDKSNRLSIVPGGGKKDGMPFAPKKFELKNDKGDATVVAIFGKAAVSGISGTVDVTAFDKRHIAGTIDLTGKLTPGGGQVKIAGAFDLICPGYGECEY